MAQDRVKNKQLPRCLWIVQRLWRDVKVYSVGKVMNHGRYGDQKEWLYSHARRMH